MWLLSLLALRYQSSAGGAHTLLTLGEHEQAKNGEGTPLSTSMSITVVFSHCSVPACVGMTVLIALHQLAAGKRVVILF